MNFNKVIDIDSIAAIKRVGIGLAKVADILDAYNTEKGGNIIMGMVANLKERGINHKGYPMALGGLYAVASKSKEELEGKDWEYGTHLISNECGFEGRFKLKKWADNNPKLWGNKFGYDMFGENRAFGIKDEDDLKLSDIVAHLRGVSERCAEAVA